MSSLSFVPRKLVVKSSSSRVLQNNPAVASSTRGDEDVKGKQKAEDASERTSKYSDTDYARLVSLALLDYALWLDPSTSHAHHGEHDAFDEEATYIPLSEIFKRFPRDYGVKYPTKPLIVKIVKVLRTYATEVIDVRLTSGGYELRLRDEVKERAFDSRQGWDHRTIYIERIPTQYRSVPGILAFLTDLLDNDPALSMHPWTRVQGVRLPSHHQDRPDDSPAFKDFCLVTMASSNDVEVLTSQWPWIRRAGTTPWVEKGETQAVREAVQFGFRALPEADWEHLRQQYLDHRTKLITEISDHEHTSTEGQWSLGKRSRGDPESVLPADLRSEATIAPTLTPDAPYPYGCLIFVRNVHPQTNKTTLRTLFSSAFTCDIQEGKGQGLDYIDYAKNMDSCHLRFSTPSCANLVMQHFERKEIVQAHGLDDEGAQASSSVSEKPIMMEKVSGRKEEVYWEKVPEKVRAQAVQKAISLLDRKGLQNDDVTGVHRRKRPRG